MGLAQHIKEHEKLGIGESSDAPNGLPEGGELGQILIKSSETDFDADWVDSSDNTAMTITRDGGVITEINWASGRKVTINRDGGVLSSVVINEVDGRTITKTFIREDEVLTGVTTLVETE